MARIYLSPPHVGPDERAMLLAAFDSNWIAPLGPDVDAFERELAAFVEVPHAAALSSGTAALHLGLEILGVGAGDEVLVSTFTFAATVNAIRYRGAVPVFVDSDEDSWNISPARLADALEDAKHRGSRPKAILVVDLYGRCADYAAIRTVTREHGLPILEDAAEALGATYEGAPAGSFGDLAVFSFNGNKIITTSGGGMLVGSNAGWIERARHLATQAREPTPHYEHREVGYNYRLSNLLAALGRAQLKNLPSRIAARKAVHERYRDALAGIGGVSFPSDPPHSTPNYWLTCIRVNPLLFGCNREVIRRALADEDIESRPTWKPMHLQPVFAGYRSIGGEVAASIFEDGLCLPSGSSLSVTEQQRVIEVILRTRARSSALSCF